MCPQNSSLTYSSQSTTFTFLLDFCSLLFCFFSAKVTFLDESLAVLLVFFIGSSLSSSFFTSLADGRGLASSVIYLAAILVALDLEAFTFIISSSSSFIATSSSSSSSYSSFTLVRISQKMQVFNNVTAISISVGSTFFDNLSLA